MEGAIAIMCFATSPDPPTSINQHYSSTSTVVLKIEAIFGHFGGLGTTNAPLSLSGNDVGLLHVMSLTAGGWPLRQPE